MECIHHVNFGASIHRQQNTALSWKISTKTSEVSICDAMIRLTSCLLDHLLFTILATVSETIWTSSGNALFVCFSESCHMISFISEDNAFAVVWVLEENSLCALYIFVLFDAWHVIGKWIFLVWPELRAPTLKLTAVVLVNYSVHDARVYAETFKPSPW